MFRQKHKDYLLIFILLFFSGNPLSGFLFGKYSATVALFLTMILLKDEIIIPRKFYQIYSKVVFFLTIVFLFQLAELGFVSLLGILNFLVKIFTGGLIIYYFKEKFSESLFKVLYFLSFLSLVFYIFINFAGFSFPKINLSEYGQSYLLYTTAFHPSKNMGMFWEPGAYAGILTLCLALNFNHLHYYWKSHRLKLIIIIITLLTAQSTTGYLAGFVILLFYFISNKNKIVLVFVMPLIFAMGGYIYQSTDFLKEKIEWQFEKSQEQDVGEFSNTRFGSMVFDWYYIKKHPLIGNGMHEKTRYADHPDFSTGAEGVGSGNGFSNFLASMGVFFIIGYFIFLYKAFSKEGYQYAIMISVIVLLNLQGEQWFNFPIYLGLPFAKFQSIKSIRSRALFAGSISSENPAISAKI